MRSSVIDFPNLLSSTFLRFYLGCIAVCFGLQLNAQALDVSSCPTMVKRSNGNGQANSAPGDFRPQSAQNNPVAPNVTGTQYQLVPFLPSVKTGDIHFKWTSGSAINNIPVITRVWLTATGTDNAVLSNIKFGPPTVSVPSAPNYYVDYCFYGNNMPNAGRITLEFTNPQTGVAAFTCSYDLGSNATAATPVLDCTPIINTQPSNQILCGGATAVFSVGATGATAYQWQVSSDGTSFSNITNGGVYSGATSASLSVATPTTNNGKYYRAILSAAGCTSVTSTSARLVAYTAPTAVFNGPAAYCGFGDRSLGVAFTGTAPYSFTYTVAGTPTTVNNISASPYYISVSPVSTSTVVITSVSDANCTNNAPSGNTSVSINAFPTITPSNALACFSGSSFSLPFTSTGSANQYTVTPGVRAMPGFVNITNASYSASPISVTIPTTGVITGTYDFNISIRSSVTGCGSTTVPFTVTVNALPVVSASASSSNVCVGTNVNLLAAPANLSAYSWTASPTATISPVFNPTVTTVANTIYTVTGTDANGCSATGNVTVNTIAGPSLSVTASASGVCNGGSTFLTASGGSTYSWSPATGLTATQGATVIATPSVTTTYTVISQNSSGCASSGSVTVTATTPSVTITNSSPTVCLGNISALTATAGLTTYVWSPLTGLFTDAAATIAYTGTSIAAVYAKPTATTTYTVLATSPLGCMVNSASTVTVYVPPIDVATSVSNNFTFCATGTSSFVLPVNVTSSVTSMTWSYSTTQAGPYTSFTSVVSPAGATFTPSSTGGNNATLTVSGFSNGGYGGPRFIRLVIVGGGCTFNYNIQIYDVKGSGSSLPAPLTTQNNICIGNSTTLFLGTINSNLTIQWQSSADSTTWANISGATASSYTTPALNVNTFYKVVLSGSGSCGYTTAGLKIIVGGSITNNTFTASATCTDGVSNIVMTGQAITNGIYLWQRSTTSSSTGFVDLPGGTNQNYTLNRNLVSTTTWYRRNVSTSSCNTNTSAATAVYPPVNNNTISTGSATTYCVTSPSIILNGSVPVGGDAAYTYQWQSSTDGTTYGNISAATSQNYTTTSQSVTMYYRRNITSGGCALSTSAPIIITRNANPVVTVSPTSGSICGGNSISLFASGAASYSWSPATDLSTSTGSTTTSTLTANRTYVVTGTNSFGCTATASAVLTFTAAPAVPTVSTTSVTVCAMPYNLTALVTSGGTNEWFTAPSPIGTYLVSTPSAVSQPGTYYVFSKSGSCYSASSVAVTVTLSDVTAPVVNSTSINLCSPATANLVSLQPSATTGTILEWHTGSTSGSPIVSTPASAGAGTYYLFAKSVNGNCYGSASAAVTVAINALPVTTVSSSPAAVCFPSTVNLNNFNTTGNGTFTYQWYSVSSNPSPSSLVNIPTDVNTAGNYYLFATNASGCKGNASSPLAVSINSKPTAAITAPVTLCAGNAININTSTNASGPVYVWKISTNSGSTYNTVSNSGIYSGATSSTLSISNSTGLDGYQYKYDVTSSANCTTESDNVIVSVDGIASLNAQPSNYTATVNGSALFKITTTGSPTVNYQWKVSTDGGSTYNNVTDGGTYQGTTTPDLIVQTAPVGFNGYRYRCEISNNCTAATNSSAAILSVNSCTTATVGGSVSGGATVCTGTNSTTLTLSGHTGTILNWERSNDNFATDPIVINNTSTSQTATNLSASTQYRAVVQSGACVQAASSIATIEVKSAGAWIGGTNGDWNNAANWCGGVPVAPSYVQVPSGSTITITNNNALATNVTIAAGGSLIMNGTGNLIVSDGGIFTNNGTFNASASTTGKVSFSGSGVISGTVAFKNIETFGAINFGTASTIDGEFTLQTGGSVVGNSPTYTCPGASLIYNTGSVFSRSLEWTSATSGAGYPSNVLVKNNTTINFPVAGAGYVCNDLSIESGSALDQDFSGGSAPLTVARDVTVTGSLTLGTSAGGDLSLGRNWTRNSGGTFTHNNRSVNFIGANNSAIAAPILTVSRDANGAFGGETFYKVVMNKADISNTLTLSSHISVLHEIGFMKGTFNLANSDVTIVSNDDETGCVGPIPTSGGVITGVAFNYSGTGKFVIQRYLSIGGTSVSRRWRLLSTPLSATSAPTINEAWQSGVSNADRNAPVDPWPGFGTTLTKSTTYSAADGYDQGSTNNPSIYYIPSVGSSIGILPSTKVPITNYEGYMIFVRGNRGIVVSTPTINANSTILEPKGRINTGDIQKSLITGFNVIGNPYAASINFNNITVNNYTISGTTFNNVTPGTAQGIGLTYYLWDPKTSGASNVGKYITFSSNGDGSYAVTGNSSGFAGDGIIQSSAALLIGADNTGGTLTFHETDKSAASNLVGIASRGTGANETVSKLVTNLFAGSGTAAIITDGVISGYNSAYNNAVDGQDAKKLSSFNTKESLTILRDGKSLAIERRNQIADNDTIFLNMSNMNIGAYQFQLNATNIDPSVIAVLEDKFKGTSSPVSLTDTTTIAFDITSNTGSADVNRFKIVFKKGGVLPITFSNISANKQDNNIAVQWSVQNEEGINNYSVERSANGQDFQQVNITKAKANGQAANSYSWLDVNAHTGDNYYRIKSNSINAGAQYTRIVKVTAAVANSEVQIYPNPVKSGAIGLRFTNMVAGAYTCIITNNKGEMVYQTIIKHPGGNAGLTLKPSHYMAAGNYFLNMEGPGKTRQLLQIIVQ